MLETFLVIYFLLNNLLVLYFVIIGNYELKQHIKNKGLISTVGFIILLLTVGMPMFIYYLFSDW